jgi:hypothetical protein
MKRLVRVFLIFAALATAVLFSPGPAVDADPGNTVTSPDTGDVGGYPSLALDASGNPVISYLGYGQYPATSGLKVLHCDDTSCAGDESGNIRLVDTGFDSGMGAIVPGYYTSLVLDASDNAVVSYRRPNLGPYVGALKLLHCGNPSCTGRVVTEPDPTADGGVTSSLALDVSGYPVVSHFDGDNTHLNLRLIHCNDSNCTGGGESLTAPDTAGYVGSSSSLDLDAFGNPVISYIHGDGELRLLHCDDPNCSGDESANIEVPDIAGYPLYTSLELDGGGYPIVSYYERDNGDLKVLHCNDPHCDPSVNGPESIKSPDTGGDVGSYSSLELDANGRPVISYYDATNGNLKVMHCNDANCDPAVSGAESIAAADGLDDNVGQWTSLALDVGGNPVVSYYDVTHQDLKLLHCDSLACGAPFSPAVGGVAELPDVAAAPRTASWPPDSDYALLAGGLTATVFAAVASAWYARRRRGS